MLSVWNASFNLIKKKPAFYDIHTLSARNPKLEAEERTRRRPFVNQQKWWKKRKEATREETFQKTARQLRILAGFGSQGGACESSNPCGIIITEKKEKEESKGGGEKRADQSARYLTNTGVCWPPLLPRTNRETIRRIFFFFFLHTHVENRAYDIDDPNCLKNAATHRWKLWNLFSGFHPSPLSLHLY